MRPVDVIRGDGPIILGQPHGGTFMPPDISMRLNENGRLFADTDWHIDTLYEGLLPEATTVRATFHRYVIDANRDPAGHSLYPGQNTTGLCPTTDFDGNDIWLPGEVPTPEDIATRVASFHAPYHQVLAAEVERVKLAHGYAIVFDCHSIRSRIPYLFDGILPEINIGTDNGTTCAPAMERAVHGLAQASGFSHVLNGRFRGGWTTRHYGQPKRGVHAIQMEIAQSAYLEQEAPPWHCDPAKLEPLRAFLKQLLTALQNIRVEV